MRSTTARPGRGCGAVAVRPLGLGPAGSGQRVRVVLAYRLAQGIWAMAKAHACTDACAPAAHSRPPALLEAR